KRPVAAWSRAPKRCPARCRCCSAWSGCNVSSTRCRACWRRHEARHATRRHRLGAMKFTLLSYNIHRAIGVDRRVRVERVVEILRHHAADIALLQEVDEGAPRSRELNLAHELAHLASYPHHALGHNVTLRK